MKQYINIDGEVFRVKEYNGGKLKEGAAYIRNGVVFPYKGKYKKKHTKGVGVYKNDDEHVFIKPIGRIKQKYSEDNIYQLDIEYISKIIEVDGLKGGFDEALSAEVGELFIPPISEDDNELQVIIKKALAKKQIDIKNYAHRFKSQTDMNNHKRAIINHVALSMDKFKKLCDIFDIEFEIHYRDKPGCANPMGEEGVVSNMPYKEDK